MPILDRRNNQLIEDKDTRVSVGIDFPFARVPNQDGYFSTTKTTIESVKNNIKLLYISFIQAFLSAIISCLIAIPFALCLYRHKELLISKLIISLCGFSFVLPSILIVFSVIGLFGTNGVLNNYTNFYQIFNIKSIFGLKAIILGHILLNGPFATRLFFQNLNTISKNYVDLSKALGLGFWTNTIKIEWPILKQTILSRNVSIGIFTGIIISPVYYYKKGRF